MKEQVISIISNVTGQTTDMLLEHESELRSWDSLKHIEILLLIEEEFDIRFEEEKIGELNSVKALCEAVERMV